MAPILDFCIAFYAAHKRDYFDEANLYDDPSIPSQERLDLYDLICSDMYDYFYTTI